MRRIREDSLDDFDIDGKIAKDRASQSEEMKAFVEDFKSNVRELFSQGVSVSMENAGLEYSKYLHKDKYKIYSGNLFGLDYKPGALYLLEIALGEYGSLKWYGDLYTHDGPDPQYHPDAIHIKEVSEEIRQDIYQCIKDKWDIYYMTDEWGISFEDCFKMGKLEKTSAGGLYSGCFLIRCSFKIPEPKGSLTESAGSPKIMASSLNELISKVEELGYECFDVDGNWLYLEKDGYEYEAEYFYYSGGNYEIMLHNICKTGKSKWDGLEESRLRENSERIEVRDPVLFNNLNKVGPTPIRRAFIVRSISTHGYINKPEEVTLEIYEQGSQSAVTTTVPTTWFEDPTNIYKYAVDTGVMIP